MFVRKTGIVALARPLPSYPALVVNLARDGRMWRIGTDADVAWIVGGTSMGRTITAAVPPSCQANATLVLPEGGQGQDRHDQAVLTLLREQSPDQPWWLGYLDTGADDIVFPDAPMVTLYSGWHYVLVEGGPEQAGDLAQRRSAVVLEGRPTQPDVPSRPLVAGVDPVGRRMDLYRWTGGTRERMPERAGHVSSQDLGDMAASGPG